MSGPDDDDDNIAEEEPATAVKQEPSAAAPEDSPLNSSDESDRFQPGGGPPLIHPAAFAFTNFPAFRPPFFLPHLPFPIPPPLPPPPHSSAAVPVSLSALSQSGHFLGVESGDEEDAAGCGSPPTSWARHQYAATVAVATVLHHGRSRHEEAAELKSQLRGQPQLASGLLPQQPPIRFSPDLRSV
jgi:hypothetical protein